jgi:hypothetical protein
MRPEIHPVASVQQNPNFRQNRVTPLTLLILGLALGPQTSLAIDCKGARPSATLTDPTAAPGAVRTRPVHSSDGSVCAVFVDYLGPDSRLEKVEIFDREFRLLAYELYSYESGLLPFERAWTKMEVYSADGDLLFWQTHDKGPFDPAGDLIEGCRIAEFLGHLPRSWFIENEECHDDS